MPQPGIPQALLCVAVPMTERLCLGRAFPPTPHPPSLRFAVAHRSSIQSSSERDRDRATETWRWRERERRRKCGQRSRLTTLCAHRNLPDGSESSSSVPHCAPIRLTHTTASLGTDFLPRGLVTTDKQSRGLVLDGVSDLCLLVTADMPCPVRRQGKGPICHFFSHLEVP